MGNKKHFFCLFVIAIVIVFNSCSKKKDEQDPQNTCNYVKEWVTYNYWDKVPGTTKFTYDSKGRVVFVKGDGLNQSSFTYTNNTIELNATNIYGINTKLTFYLDNQNRITGTNYFDNDCKYNSEGYLISYRSPATYNDKIVGYTVYTLIYQDGNLVKVTAPDPKVSGGNVDFEYFDKPAQDCLGYNSPLYIGGPLGERDYFILIPAGFFGKPSKSLLKSVNLNEQNGPFSRKYQFDSKGRIIREGNYGFSYQCD